MECDSDQNPANGLPELTLVFGGVSSGKTNLAERLVAASGGRPVYIATAEPRDREMRDKIERHRQSRGEAWKTIEAPLDVSAALAECKRCDAVLIDCVTIWLSNVVCSGMDTETACDSLLKAIDQADFPILIVSNEVGLGGIAGDPKARLFARLQGELNQRLSTRADLVIAVIAGLPLKLKGDAPQWL